MAYCLGRAPTHIATLGYAKRKECSERELVINIQQPRSLLLFNVNLICVCVLTAGPR